MGGQRRVLGVDDRNECTTLPTATLDDAVTLSAVVTSRRHDYQPGSAPACAAKQPARRTTSSSHPAPTWSPVRSSRSRLRVPGSAPIYLSTCEVDNRLCTNGLLTTTGATGTLATPYTVQRTVAFRVIGLRAASGARGGSEAVSSASSPLAFRNIQPDLRQRRRSDGTIFFDDVYTLFSNPPMSHAIDPVASGLRCRSRTTATRPTTSRSMDRRTRADPARYVVGWYDVSAAVGASGFTFHDVPPGEVITFGLRFEAPPASPGTVEVVLSARSANDSNAVDREGFRVDVSTPGWTLHGGRTFRAQRGPPCAGGDGR